MAHLNDWNVWRIKTVFFSKYWAGQNKKNHKTKIVNKTKKLLKIGVKQLKTKKKYLKKIWTNMKKYFKKIYIFKKCFYIMNRAIYYCKDFNGSSRKQNGHCE